MKKVLVMEIKLWIIIEEKRKCGKQKPLGLGHLKETEKAWRKNQHNNLRELFIGSKEEAVTY